MSKLSPLGQSMASLFTPETERLRSSNARDGKAPPGAVRVPGGRDLLKGKQSGDTLGNPNSPGYEPWGKKKKKEEGGNAGPEFRDEAPGPAGTVIETPVEGPQLIRLSVGWDKILLAQKKLCEKAKGLFTILEGPDKYTAQRKSKALAVKSRGCIVDLDVQEIADAKEAEAKSKAKEGA